MKGREDEKGMWGEGEREERMREWEEWRMRNGGEKKVKWK
jgi:hypothetical protein